MYICNVTGAWPLTALSTAVCFAQMHHNGSHPAGGDERRSALGNELTVSSECWRGVDGAASQLRDSRKALITSAVCRLLLLHITACNARRARRASAARL